MRRYADSWRARECRSSTADADISHGHSTRKTMPRVLVRNIRNLEILTLPASQSIMQPFEGCPSRWIPLLIGPILFVQNKGVRMEAQAREEYQLSEVFNEASVPVVTFVPPKEFQDLVGSLRTKGKHVTLSGPSGCGKTTLAQKAFDKAKIPASDQFWISGRDYTDEKSASSIFSKSFSCEPMTSEIVELLKIAGFIVIDDFHHLHSDVRAEIASKLKRWAELGIRFLIIGISSLNKELIETDYELSIRNDVYEMGAQEPEFIRAVIEAGENALGFHFSSDTRAQFEKVAIGVPSAIQMICRVACTRAEIFETLESYREVSINLEDIKESILRSYKAKFQNRLIGMAKGKQQARSVHNTYFDIVRQICTLELSEIPISELHGRIVKVVPEAKERARKNTSFYNCLNNLSEVIKERGLDDAIYYNQKSEIISVEDPSFRLYLTLVDIDEVEKSVRVRKTRFPWDVAVSFAGEDRATVEEFKAEMNSNGYTVFYDFDEQHKLWGENLRRKLGDVYAHDAQYMVVFLSKHYPEKDWTSFELEIGKEAKSKRTATYLLPIIVDDVTVVGLSKDVGYIDLRSRNIQQAAEVLSKKIEDDALSSETS